MRGRGRGQSIGHPHQSPRKFGQHPVDTGDKLKDTIACTRFMVFGVTSRVELKQVVVTLMSLLSCTAAKFNFGSDLRLLKHQTGLKEHFSGKGQFFSSACKDGCDFECICQRSAHRYLLQPVSLVRDLALLMKPQPSAKTGLLDRSKPCFHERNDQLAVFGQICASWKQEKAGKPCGTVERAFVKSGLLTGNLPPAPCDVTPMEHAQISCCQRQRLAQEPLLPWVRACLCC